MRLHELREIPRALRDSPLGRYLLPAVLSLGLIAGGVWYWRESQRPEHALDAALSAIERGDRHEVTRLAGMLEQRGHREHAAYVRAAQQRRQAQRLRVEAAGLARQEAIELAARLCLHEAGALGDGFVPCRSHVCAQIGLPVIGSRIGPRLRLRVELEERIRGTYRAAYEQVRHIAPQSALGVEAAIIAGECLVHLGAQREAAAAWTFVAEHRPGHADAHRHLAVIFYDTGAMPRAVHHLEQLADLEPQDGRPQRQIGLIMKDDKHSRLAIAAYQEALRRSLAPATRAEVVKELAELWLGEGEADYGQALATLDLCPAEYTGRPEFLVLRADALWKSRRNEVLAVQLVEQALALDPECVEALVVWARMHLDVEQPAAAVPLMAKAARLAPHHLAVCTQYALVASRLAGQVQAGAHSEACLLATLHGLGDPPCFPPLGSGIATALLEPWAASVGRRRDAEQSRVEQLSLLSRQAMERVWDDRIRCQIAQLWLETDNVPLARSWFGAALTCNPENAEARQALRRLDGR